MSESVAAGAAQAPAFNLLDEPWIPVRLLDGSLKELGLLAIFQRGREIEGLAETSPPALVALHRLLLAVTHRALSTRLGRWSTSDRVRWYDDGLPTDHIAAYLEQWRDRCWLFHPAQPFMQVAALALPLPGKAPARFASGANRDPKDDDPPLLLEAKAWTQIALESVSGNNPVVFDHCVDDAPQPIAPAHALRLLLAYLQYAPGQPVKALCKSGNDLSGPIFNSASVIPIGTSLAQSLVLGLHPPAVVDSDDTASWERAPLTVARLLSPATPAAGPCDRYTRQTRAVLFLRDANGGVSRLRFAEGQALLDDPNASDPMSSYRAGTDGWVRLTLNEGRAVWRDLASLLPDSSGKMARPAAILNGAATLLAATGQPDQSIEFLVAGLAAKQGKMLRARIERFRMPQGVLCSADAAATTRQALLRAEEVFGMLRKLAASLVANTLPDPGHKDTLARARDIVAAGPVAPVFFSVAERDLPRLLQAIAQGDIEGAHALWSATLLRAARVAWQVLGDTLGESGAALRARALMHGRFQQLLQPLYPETRSAGGTFQNQDAEQPL